MDPSAAGLPPAQWTVLILRDVLGWPAAEAAALLGVTVANLDRVLVRARAAVPADVGPEAPDRAALQRLIGSTDPAEVSLVRALLRGQASIGAAPGRAR